MKWIRGLTLASLALCSALCALIFCGSAVAATERTRLRGTVADLNGQVLTVHVAGALDVPVTLGANLKVLKVTPASLGSIAPGSYIGTAAKTLDGMSVALEVLIFPPSMQGAGEGHFGWDRLADTTPGAAPGSMAATTMTNGHVAAVGPARPHPAQVPGQPAAADTTMINGRSPRCRRRAGPSRSRSPTRAASRPSWCRRPSRW